MGKKGSLFSAIKRDFLPHSKEKLNNESDKRSDKEKKKGLKSRHGETNSFLLLFRKPSSIEKILGEAEQEHNLIFRPPTPPEQPRTPPFVPHRPASPRVPSPRVASPRAAASPRSASPRAASPRVASPRAASPRAASPRVASPRSASPRAASPRVASPRAASPRFASPRAAPPRVVHPRPEPTLRNQHASATQIQASYRGFKSRRSFRALKGLVRLQGVVRGQHVKRQTMNSELKPKPNSELKPSPRLKSSSSKQGQFTFDNITETPTPKSTRSNILPPRGMRTPPSGSRPRSNRAGSPFSLHLKDDDSLISCPPLSVPSYMNPTVSTKAKARANSNPKERYVGTPRSESNRRLSYPFSQGIGSSKGSVSNFSVDSRLTTATNATEGRKPFNRFV